MGSSAVRVMKSSAMPTLHRLLGPFHISFERPEEEKSRSNEQYRGSYSGRFKWFWSDR